MSEAEINIERVACLDDEALAALPIDDRLELVRVLSGADGSPAQAKKARTQALRLLLTNPYDPALERHEDELLRELRGWLYWDSDLRQVRENWDYMEWGEVFEALDRIRAYCAHAFGADPGGPLGHFSLSREQCLAAGSTQYPLMVAFPKTVDDFEAQRYPGLTVREPFSVAVNVHHNASAVHYRYPAFEAFVIHEQTHVNDFYWAEQVRTGQMAKNDPRYPMANSIRAEIDGDFYKKEGLIWEFSRASMLERHAHALQHKMAALWQYNSTPAEYDVLRYDFKDNGTPWPRSYPRLHQGKTALIKTLSSFLPQFS